MGASAAESNGRSEHTEALYREHGAAVAALCRSLLRDRAEAEDAAQQVFLSAHRALLNGTVPREPLAWLLAVARNECYARFRRHAATPVPAEAPDGTAADASVHVLQADGLASMWDEVERLPPAQREAFLLREIRGLSYRQLAAELSLSPPSVRSLLLRARTRLRHQLRDALAAFGGASWVQPLLRIVSGGDGPSPVPAATKAVAVGLGTLALAGGGSLARVEHHASRARGHVTPRHRTESHVRHRVAPPDALAIAAGRKRSVLGRGSDGSGSGRDGSHDGRTDSRGSGSGGDSGSGDGSSGTTMTTGSDGGGETSAGSGTSGSDGAAGATTTTFTQTTSSDRRDGGSSGSSSGSDGGSGTVTTATTTTTSTGSDSGSGSDGHGGGSDGG